MHIVQRKLLTKSVGLFRAPERTFYGFLLNIFNRPSASRIKEVGPDRACAEWLLKNGAAIRWKGGNEFITDYNCLPLSEDTLKSGPFYIEDVDATEAAISNQGFRHFDGCNHVKKIILVRNYYLGDGALPHLNFVAKTLNFLEIKSCASVTEKGLRSLFQLSNLKNLHLQDLEGVKDRKKITSELETALSGCKVTYPN